MRLWEEADALSRKDSDAAAAARLEEAADQDPGNARLRTALGDRLLRLGRPDDALATYAKADRLGPRELRLRQHLAARLGR